MIARSTVFVFLFMFAFSVLSSAEAKRVALVIGNNSYDNVPKLLKAVNDAKAVGDTLKDLGFMALYAENLSRREMNRKLQTFAGRIEKSDEALFYFAGHGVEINGRNYLLPTDIPKATPGQEGFVTGEAIAVDRILNIVRARGARVSILILDACRDNPFPTDGTRSVGASRGLGRIVAPEGTFIMYSAGVGQQALDRLNNADPNPNSVFTRTLIPLLKSPGLKLTDTARQLRREVKKLAATVSHSQRPAYYDEVTGEFFFTPGKRAPGQQPPTPTVSADQILWDTIKTSKKASDFEFYLSKFPKGRYSAVAELRVSQMKQKKLAIVSPPPKPKVKKPVKPAVGLSFEPGNTFRDCTDCPEMVVVPAGQFTMGSSPSEISALTKKHGDFFKDEGPQRKVTIAKPFAVGKYEVTRDQFQAFVDATGHKPGNKCWTYDNDEWKERSGRSFRKPGFQQSGDHPVVCVNWDDAQAYVKWMNGKVKGAPYKLLSEAEWEYVARAKSDTPFWWGSSISTDQANYDGNYTYNGAKGVYRKKTVAVDSFKPNAFGLYNVHGNVWEWTQDCWHSNYEDAPTDGSAWLKANGGDCAKRVLRGGSWVNYPLVLRSADRGRFNRGLRYFDGGFRLSRTLTP